MAEQTEMVGRSPAALALRRLRHDVVAMISLAVILVVSFFAIAAPWITSAIGVNPYDFHPELISDNGGLPHGIAGGVSWAHPLGVEPLTGRDILARLLYGSSVSLLIAVTATVLTVSFGTIIVIVSGYVRGWLGPSRGARRGGNHRSGLQPSRPWQTRRLIGGGIRLASDHWGDPDCCGIHHHRQHDCGCPLCSRRPTCTADSNMTRNA